MGRRLGIDLPRRQRLDARQIPGGYPAGPQQPDPAFVDWKFQSNAARRTRTHNVVANACDANIEEFSRRAFACNDDLGALLLVRRTSAGVGPALGSALLMANDPARYSVIDVNAIKSLHAVGFGARPRNSSAV